MSDLPCPPECTVIMPCRRDCPNGVAYRLREKATYDGRRAATVAALFKQHEYIEQQLRELMGIRGDLYPYAWTGLTTRKPLALTPEEIAKRLAEGRAQNPFAGIMVTTDASVPAGMWGIGNAPPWKSASLTRGHSQDLMRAMVYGRSDLGRAFDAAEFVEEPPPPPSLAVRKTTQPIIAWRAWRLLRHGKITLLAAISEPDVWPVGARMEIRAPVSPMLRDTTGRRSDDGIHAWKERRRVIHPSRVETPSHVMGTVALWGKIIAHKDGYRAQYGYPQALVCTNDEQRAVARLYGAEVIA